MSLALKAITVLLPEPSAAAMLEAARCTGDFLGSDTIRLKDHIMVRKAVFDSLMNEVPLTWVDKTK